MPFHRGRPVRHLSNMCDDLIQGDPEFVHHVTMPAGQRKELAKAKSRKEPCLEAEPFAEFMVSKRRLLGLSRGEAAKRIGITEERLEDFENAITFPTMQETFSIRIAYDVGKERMHIKRFSK